MKQNEQLWVFQCLVLEHKMTPKIFKRNIQKSILSYICDQTVIVCSISEYCSREVAENTEMDIGVKWWWGRGVARPRPRKLSMASYADLHCRIHSSWRNHISSHGAEPGQQPDPNKRHLFYTTKEKERKWDWRREGEGLGGVGGGGGGLECSSQEKRRLSARGFGANELRKETTGGLWARASVFQLNFSLSLGNRYIDLLTLSAAVRTSCLRPPCRTTHLLRAKSHFSGSLWPFVNYSTESSSCPDSLPCFLYSQLGSL